MKKTLFAFLFIISGICFTSEAYSQGILQYRYSIKHIGDACVDRFYIYDGAQQQEATGLSYVSWSISDYGYSSYPHSPNKTRTDFYIPREDMEGRDAVIRVTFKDSNNVSYSLSYNYYIRAYFACP
ncbi:hypothetical protein AB9P05_10430 [Roseivirga sp. BDSF3-8]|uniref:hypothetical protein n=1 Tax=Roseivirga sp. BDSF3-8 TaxID=3241598 RepID=UPI003532781F